MTIPHVPYRWKPTSAEFNVYIDAINGASVAAVEAVQEAEDGAVTIGYLNITNSDEGIYFQDGSGTNIGYVWVTDGNINVEAEDGDASLAANGAGDVYVTSARDAYLSANDGLGDIWIRGGSLRVNNVPLYVPQTATVTATETTTSTTLTDLTTVGPAVTMVTGTMVRVTFVVSARRTAGTGNVNWGVAVSGASTQAAPAGTTTAGGAGSLQVANSPTSVTTYALDGVIYGLTPGSNTFTLKYRVGTAGATGEFSNRLLRIDRLD